MNEDEFKGESIIALMKCNHKELLEIARLLTIHFHLYIAKLEIEY